MLSYINGTLNYDKNLIKDATLIGTYGMADGFNKCSVGVKVMMNNGIGFGYERDISNTSKQSIDNNIIEIVEKINKKIN